MDLKIFDPLYHLLNILAVTTIVNFPGSTYEEFKSGIERICFELDIKIIKIGVNIKQNIVYVTTEIESALKLFDHTNKTRYYSSILESSVEPFSEKHPIPFNYVKQKIDSAIREELRNIKVSNFDSSTKQVVWNGLKKLMKENSIQSLGIIFSNQDTTANVYVEKKNANKLNDLVENANFND